MHELTRDTPLSRDERIRRIVADVLGVDDVDPDANIIGLGANSMEIVRIINRIEDETGKRLRFETVGFDASVTSLIASLTGADDTPGPLSDGFDRAAAAAVLPHASPRRQHDGWPRYPLAADTPPASVRGSVRMFTAVTVPRASLASLLATLAQGANDASPRAAYASAGGFYSVQTYLAVKPGAVEGLPCGLYYFEPSLCELWLIAPDLIIDRAHYDPLQNAPIYDRAGFSLHLVAAPGDALRAYGARARDYCLLEAGAMAQRLREGASAAGIGLCAIGDFAFEPLRAWFDVDDAQECLHTLVGGMPG